MMFKSMVHTIQVNMLASKKILGFKIRSFLHADSCQNNAHTIILEGWVCSVRQVRHLGYCCSQEQRNLIINLIANMLLYSNSKEANNHSWYPYGCVQFSYMT